jgi:predicted nucleic acid-binding protein
VNLVLDSSATLAWIYSDETTDAIRAQFDQVADEGAVVTALWRLEVANSLTVAVRRNSDVPGHHHRRAYQQPCLERCVASGRPLPAHTL